MAVSQTLANSAIYGRMSVAPKAQFKPKVIGLACLKLFQKASTVWPDKIRPDASVTVPEIITGKHSPVFSKNSSIANNAALDMDSGEADMDRGYGERIWRSGYEEADMYRGYGELRIEN